MTDGNGAISAHQYDAKDRLTTSTVTGPNAATYQYSYDGTDNILTTNESGGVVTYNYGFANKKITGKSSSGTATFTFDSNGNMVVVNDPVSAHTTMGYDQENRMVVNQQSDGTFATLCLQLIRTQKNPEHFRKRLNIGVGRTGLPAREVLKMAVTNYYTVNGKIRGEGTAAGGFRPYGHDALGSVVATYDITDALQNTYRNAPYGTQVAKTGTAPDPAFLYNGGSGYRTTGRNYSPYYVRKRHFDNKTAQWTTADPLWPLAALFVYALANPIHFSDSAGLFVLRDLNCKAVGQPSACTSSPATQPVLSAELARRGALAR